MIKRKGRMLLIALAIAGLGLTQVIHWRGSPGRAAKVGTASGMFALLSGVAIIIYALGRKE